MSHVWRNSTWSSNCQLAEILAARHPKTGSSTLLSPVLSSDWSECLLLLQATGTGAHPYLNETRGVLDWVKQKRQTTTWSFEAIYDTCFRVWSKGIACLHGGFQALVIYSIRFQVPPMSFLISCCNTYSFFSAHVYPTLWYMWYQFTKYQRRVQRSFIF